MRRLGITREVQDAFGAASHQKAAAAQKDGRLAEEIVPVEIPQMRKGSGTVEPILVVEDEQIRPETTVETLGKLRPAFSKDGTITAATSSPISAGPARSW